MGWDGNTFAGLQNLVNNLLPSARPLCLASLHHQPYLPLLDSVVPHLTKSLRKHNQMHDIFLPYDITHIQEVQMPDKQ